MNQTIRNIGIFAHVDAGKTSLTENILFESGAIAQMGSVDDGTSQSDSLYIEKQRGISVRSSLTSFYWKDHKINLVDTPGHVDFSADVERVLQVIDGAILLVSALDGVQSHTDTIWQALRDREIPVILFVNKIDRAGVYLEGMLSELGKELSDQYLALQQVENEGTLTVEVKPISLGSDEKHLELLAQYDDSILEAFIEEKPISSEQLAERFRASIHAAQIYPLLFGSAKLGIGIEHLLQAITEYFPSPKSTTSSDLSAIIYNLTHEEKQGRVAYARIFSGQIKVRDSISNFTKSVEEKVQTIGTAEVSKKAITTEFAGAGDIVALYGLNDSTTGDVLGVPSDAIPPLIHLHKSLLTVQVVAQKEEKYAALAEALQILSVEDPSLEFDWYREERELHLKVMGWIQIEVLEALILQRFKIEAKFEEPSVIYKETPIASGYGIGHYTMPKPCWAIVKFLIEPAPRGSGVSYKSLVRTSDVHQKYQNEVERTIPKALQQGIKGWEVTDLKITLVEGEDHQMHSRPGNFVLATPMGIMNALNEIGTQFLEPILWFKITASDELLGKLTSEIIQMRGEFDSPMIVDNKMTLTGTFPLATSLDFSVRLSSISGGKAKLLTRFYAYKVCNDSLAQIRPYKGISPLDRSKYILKMRKALE